MGVVPVTINCVIFPKAKGGSVPQPYPATLVGNAWLTGLSVGGGPIQPETPPPIEPGLPGKPTFPIWGPPGIELPPGEGYPPVAGHPLPEPPNGGQPPDPPTMVKPPPPDGGWGYSPTYGWGYFPGPGDAGPKKK
jgi:hypothetical protein